MAFTSYDFLIFFFIIFILYWLLNNGHWQNLLLLVASYYFYGSFQIWYALLLSASTLIDFFIILNIKKRPQHKHIFVWISLFINLGVLVFFKYYDFFVNDIMGFLNTINVSTDKFSLSILLPAGLSFFTLKKIGYILDVSRGTLKPTNSFVDFALYVSFFPQLVAGPIDRPQNLLTQIESQRIWKIEFFNQAWQLIIMGFFKKIVVANSIQVIVNRIFGLEEPSMFLLISGSLAYTLQILADFSAYTDLSRGFAYLLGFSTPENFRRPYLALTPTDFWNRWHITLSTWLRDYVFFPIRRALLRYSINEKLTLAIPPLITMFISGLWHGAGLNFIIWGLYYGVLIVTYQLLNIRNDWKPNSKLQTFFAWLIMFIFIVFGWTLFRSPSITWLINIFTNISFTAHKNEFILALITLTMTVAYSIPLWIKYVIDNSENVTWLQSTYYAIAVALTVIYINSANSDFIYFQF